MDLPMSYRHLTSHSLHHLGSASECQVLQAEKARAAICGFSMAPLIWLTTRAEYSCPSWCVQARRAKSHSGRSWSCGDYIERQLHRMVCIFSLLAYTACVDMRNILGNCLFRALSDQMYNTTDRHDEIRQKVVEHLRSNRQDFEAFVPFNTEEPWVRSQPSTRSSRLRREIDADDWFEAYLKDMARPKTWGGEIEIRAFCEAFDRDVLIHRPTNAGQPFDQMINMKRGDGQPRQFVHVSYGVSWSRWQIQFS